MYQQPVYSSYQLKFIRNMANIIGSYFLTTTTYYYYYYYYHPCWLAQLFV
jgi:hypothetical protein